MRKVTTTATTADLVKAPANGWQTMKRIGPYLWPKGENWVKQRVVAALMLLVVAKIISVTTPYLYKQAVDALTGKSPDAVTFLLLGSVGLTVAYGLARMGTVFFGEMRDWVFVKVGQRALRKLALETFTHIHRLSMRYHITRKTGGLSRIFDRGVNWVDFMFVFMFF
jgi:ABC-type multidrug transport system fused ATPase/permease subunit